MADILATGPATRRHRRWPKILLAGLAVLGLAGIGGVAYFVLGREEAAQRTLGEALDRYRADALASDAASAASGPAPGVYPARGEGREYVGFAPLDEPFGPGVPVTVAYRADGCWDLRVDLNSHHWRSWTYCTSEQGPVQPATVTATARKFPGIDYAIRVEFACDPPIPLLPETGAGSGGRVDRCVGRAAGDTSTTDYVGRSRVLGRETLTIGGRPVPTVHVERRGTLTGERRGSDHIEVWVHPGTGMPVRVRFDARAATPTPFGAIDYRDAGTFTLTALEPRA